MILVPHEVPNVATEDIERVFAPFVIERLALDDPRWIDESRRLEQKYRKPPKKKPRWTTAEGLRTTERVREGYESVWAGLSLRDELAGSKTGYFEWRNVGMLARTIGRKRVHHLLLARVMEWLRPASVLEVGCGNGLNLMLLSMQFPDVAFSGLELTRNGLAKARALASDELTARHLESFAVCSLRDEAAPQRIVFAQGSAEKLPFHENSVDMAVTVLALEQMERVREAALHELSRVARRHVVMIEPFRDWNGEGHRREFIRRNDYFSGRLSELREHALEPCVAMVDMPNKLTFRVGLVVAEVTGL